MSLLGLETCRRKPAYRSAPNPWLCFSSIDYACSGCSRLTTHALVVVFDGEVGQRCCDHAALLSVGRQNVSRMSRPAVKLKVKIHVLIIYPPVDLSWAMANAMKDWEKDNAGLDTMNLDR